MPDIEAITLMQQVARRWARQRFATSQPQMKVVSDNEMRGSLLGELFEQGWLPESLDDWGGATALTLARLGEALSPDATAAFMPILTHCLGLHLFRNGPRYGGAAGVQRGLIAASPYIDYSKISSRLVAKKSDSGWILSGQTPWVVNFGIAQRMVVVAREASGQVTLFNVDLPQAGCMASVPLSVFGLCSSPIHHVELSSVALYEKDVIARDRDAQESLNEGYRVARWGTLGLVVGLVRSLLKQATDYSTLRRQGGRPIIEHPAVRQLIDTARSTVDFLGQLLARLESVPLMECPIAEVRQQALVATDSALQVFGGSGYMCPGLPEQCWRDVRQAVTLCNPSTVV